MSGGVQYPVQINIWHDKLPPYLYTRHTDWQKIDWQQNIMTAKQSDKKKVADKLEMDLRITSHVGSQYHCGQMGRGAHPAHTCTHT